MTLWGSVPVEVWLALAALLIGWLGSRWIARWLDRTHRRSRVRHALAGEARARILLEECGFEIEGAQVVHEYVLVCDGAELRVGIRADFIVRQWRRRYVAEVKTGKLATTLLHAPTRRQLLEYQHAFATDGVLLVDADLERIHWVEF